MRICFVWYWPRASEIFPHWRDGLRAALEVISKKHVLTWFMDCKLPENYDDFDFVLFWGDSTLPPLSTLPLGKCRYGLCLSTDPIDIANLKKLAVVFVESMPVYNAVRKEGIRTILAFGTDTDFYKPNDKINKDIEYFYPATFSPWKKQSDIAYLGDKLLCIGTIQPDGMPEYDACKAAGVQIKEGYFPAEEIRTYYQRAKNVIIPAGHGSERTIMEAMACNILPQVTNPKNIRAQSYIKEYHLSAAKDPQHFIWSNYSHKKYAAQLLKGILNA